jgi:hypothetical protein
MVRTGRCGAKEMELCEVQELASVADWFKIAEVISSLEETVMRQLSVEDSGEVLMWCGGCGTRMLQLKADALKMAACRFKEFLRTAGFMLLGEEALGILLDDDSLAARSKEAVWESVVEWKRGAAGEVRMAWRGGEDPVSANGGGVP